MYLYQKFETETFIKKHFDIHIKFFLLDYNKSIRDMTLLHLVIMD